MTSEKKFFGETPTYKQSLGTYDVLKLKNIKFKEEM